LLWLNGEDLRDRPLSDRRLELEGLGLGESGIYFSEEFKGDGEAFFREASRAELEGIVAKRRDSKYRSGRRDEWRKIKCIRSAEFVVIGYLPSKVPGAIASLLVAEKDGKTLRYAGAVGTGYSHAVAVALKQGLDAIRATEPAILTGSESKALSGHARSLGRKSIFVDGQRAMNCGMRVLRAWLSANRPWSPNDNANLGKQRVRVFISSGARR
jgi:ATP-dependent DNA ligase